MNERGERLKPQLLSACTATLNGAGFRVYKRAALCTVLRSTSGLSDDGERPGTRGLELGSTGDAHDVAATHDAAALGVDAARMSSSSCQNSA